MAMVRSYQGRWGVGGGSAAGGLGQCVQPAPPEETDDQEGIERMVVGWVRGCFGGLVGSDCGAIGPRQVWRLETAPSRSMYPCTPHARPNPHDLSLSVPRTRPHSLRTTHMASARPVPPIRPNSLSNTHPWGSAVWNRGICSVSSHFPFPAARGFGQWNPRAGFRVRARRLVLLCLRLGCMPVPPSLFYCARAVLLCARGFLF